MIGLVNSLFLRQETRDKRIILKKDNKVISLHLVYNENGTDWWLEEDTNDDEVMD